MAAVALGALAGALYLASQRTGTLEACTSAEEQLHSMEMRNRTIKALRQSVAREQPVAAGTGQERPLLEFLEEAAERRRVKITNVSPREAVESRRTLLARARVFREQETWVQVTEGRLESLVALLNEVEMQVPAYFVKEISGLVPNEGKGDDWRARVVLCRIDVREE
jgi:hypothetical protein